MSDPMDPAGDGQVETDDLVTILKLRLADAEESAARAIGRDIRRQRLVAQLRERVLQLTAALNALEAPADEEVPDATSPA